MKLFEEEVFYIILGLLIGFFFMYAIIPSAKIILKYPTLENSLSTTYIDKMGQCYKYYPMESSCVL